MKRTCGYCLFAEDEGSTDVLWCWKVKKHRDVMDLDCAAFKVNPELRGATAESAMEEGELW